MVFHVTVRDVRTWRYIFYGSCSSSCWAQGSQTQTELCKRESFVSIFRGQSLHNRYISLWCACIEVRARALLVFGVDHGVLMGKDTIDVRVESSRSVYELWSASVTVALSLFQSATVLADSSLWISRNSRVCEQSWEHRLIENLVVLFKNRFYSSIA